MPRNDEARIQASVVDYVRTVAPDLVIYAVPNGGLRTKAEAALLKWTGVLSGVPDLALVLPGGRSAFMEIKTPKGVLSEAQRGMRMRFIRMGVPCATVRSIEDARLFLAQLGVITREAA